MFLYLKFVSISCRVVKFLAIKLIRQILLFNVMVRKIMGIFISYTVPKLCG